MREKKKTNWETREIPRLGMGLFSSAEFTGGGDVSREKCGDVEIVI